MLFFSWPNSIRVQGRRKIKIPVQFKPGLQAGKKRVEYGIVIEEGNGKKSTILLGLTLEAVPAWEIQLEKQDLITIKRNSVEIQTCKIVSRKLSQKGLDFPKEIYIDHPFSIKSLGKVSKTQLPGGMTETTQTIEIELLDYSKPGFYSGLVHFKWADGTQKEKKIQFEIIPDIQISPSFQTINSRLGEVDLKFVIRSSTSDFRILDIKSPLIIQKPTFSSWEMKKQYAISLKLNTKDLQKETLETIEIFTDHQFVDRISYKFLITPSQQ